MLRNSAETWGTVAKNFHWWMAALIFAQFALGLMAANWHLSPTKLQLFIWHKSIGMLILPLLVARILWRAASVTPTLPGDMPAWEHRAAQASHGLLYALMIALPLSGWVINSAANIPFRIFGLVRLPAITQPDKQTAELFERVHVGLVIALVLVLVVHVVAALRHHFVKRDTVLARMLPVMRWPAG